MWTAQRFRLVVAMSLAALFFAAAAMGAGASFELTSSAFAAGGAIPSRYTCDGEDVSPPLAWGDPPAHTKSFALVVDDPDAPDPAAPRMRWVHWVVLELPPDARALKEGIRSVVDLPAGARFGSNDWGNPTWSGPCPPIGRHRYIFTLYALDIALTDSTVASRRTLEAAIQGHVLAQAELIGMYERRR